MSKMNDLSYEIEQLFIEGYSPKTIAVMMECPLEVVYDWIEAQNIEVQEEYDPYDTINS